MVRKLAKSLFTLSVLGVALTQAACQKDAVAPAAPEAAASKPGAAAVAQLPPAVAAGEVRKVALTVTAKGYEPSPLLLRKGEPVELTITRTTDETCATELVLEEAGLDVKLPLNEAVVARFTPEKSGELKYGCAMGKMISGVFTVQ